MLKLSPYLLLLFLLSALFASAQTGTHLLERIKPFTLEPHKIDFDKQLPFSSLQVKDSRLDTTQVGYGINRESYRKLVLEGGTTTCIQKLLGQALSQKLDTAVQQSLLIVIKQLWLSELHEAELPEKRGADPTKMPTAKTSRCVARLEVFAQKQDGYIPLFRIDSVFASGRPIQLDGEELISAPFVYCLQKLSRLNYTKVVAATQRFTWSQINELSNKRFHQPILTDSTLERGLYLTFSDFRNNKLTKKEFEVRYGREADKLYVFEGSDRGLFMELWGYCDGKKLFIRKGKSFYELERKGNTFGYLAPNGLPNSPRRVGYLLSSTPTGTLANVGAAALTNAIFSTIDGNGLKPFFLDLDTGDSY